MRLPLHRSAIRSVSGAQSDQGNPTLTIPELHIPNGLTFPYAEVTVLQVNVGLRSQFTAVSGPGVYKMKVYFYRLFKLVRHNVKLDSMSAAQWVACTPIGEPLQDLTPLGALLNEWGVRINGPYQTTVNPATLPAILLNGFDYNAT